MTMPNFLIIGAMKAGTTALYRYLCQHPQIYMSPVKETNFFAFEGETLDFRAPIDQEGINRRSITDLQTYRGLFDGAVNEKARGEVSHWYMYRPKACERIRHHIPDVKLIAVLRNPVDRAYSDFMHFVRGGLEPITDFSRALEEEEIRIRDNWAMGHYGSRVFYYAQLKRYFDTFDEEQIQVYLYDDLKADPINLLQDVFRFLGTDETFKPDISLKPNVSGVPKNKALHYLLTKPKRAKAVIRPLLPARITGFAADIRNRNLVKP